MKPSGFADFLKHEKSSVVRESRAADFREMAAAKLVEAVGKALFASGPSLLRLLREEDRHSVRPTGILDLFHERFAEFPLRLHVPPAPTKGGLARHDGMKLSQLFYKFPESPLYSGFLKLAASANPRSLNGRGFAVVFPFAGIPRGLLAVHSAGYPQALVEGLKSVFCYRVPGNSGSYVVLSPFSNYLSHLANAGFRLE